jgi:hypothetical protein
MQWALGKYAEKSAADLELLSTIVYADRVRDAKVSGPNGTAGIFT